MNLHILEGNLVRDPELKTSRTGEPYINFTVAVNDKFNKDAKYYINATYKKDERYITVLKTYNEFLKLNEGFKNVKTTADINLPSNLKVPSTGELKTIKQKIDEAISLKDLTKLFDVYELILG